MDAPVGPSSTLVGSVDRMSLTITTESPPLMPIWGAPVSPYASSEVAATTTRDDAALPTSAVARDGKTCSPSLISSGRWPGSSVDTAVLPVRPSARVSCMITVASLPTASPFPVTVVQDSLLDTFSGASTSMVGFSPNGPLTSTLS